MIIKSLSRKKASFKQLYHYINKQADKTSIFTHNLRQNEDIIKQFQDNQKLVVARKKGNCLYHEVLSFSNKEQNITLEEIKDLAEKWLELRADKNLAYGAVHYHKTNKHVHLMISANELLQRHNLRLTKEHFKEAKIKLEEFQRVRYPHLQLSLCQELKDKKQNPLKDKEYQRYKRTEAVSDKDKLKSIIYQATQEKDFERYLKAHNIEIYKRGKNNGIIYQDKKYRFNTLDFDPKLDELQKQKTRENLREVERKKEEPQKEKPNPERDDPQAEILKTLQKLKERDALEKEKEYERGRDL